MAVANDGGKRSEKSAHTSTFAIQSHYRKDFREFGVWRWLVWWWCACGLFTQICMRQMRMRTESERSASASLYVVCVCACVRVCVCGE